MSRASPTPRDEAAQAALAAMQKMSPTSLKVTLRNVRDAASFKRVEESFQQDYRIALACIAGHDFIEGIRAQIVDKDRNPRWRPDTLEGVTPRSSTGISSRSATWNYVSQIRA